VEPLVDKNVGDLSYRGAHPERFFAWTSIRGGWGERNDNHTSPFFSVLNIGSLRQTSQQEKGDSQW
jgi:hypothetical protein